MINKLLDKIKNKKITLGVVGLGNVGLNLVLKASKENIQFFGIDTDEEKISSLKKNKSYLSYISDEEISKMSASSFSSNYDQLKKCDVICLCLPTDFNHKPALEIFYEAFKEVLSSLNKNSLIIIESTLPPLTTENNLLPLISKSFSLGNDLFLGICPERINPGKKDEYQQSETRIFSGFDAQSKELTKSFYKSLGLETHEVSNFRTAEFTKIYENAYRAINIIFTDQMQMLSQEIEVNIHEIIHAANSKGLGFTPYFPSSGIGGGCIPMSLEYLQYLGEKVDLQSDLIQSAIKNSHDKTRKIAYEISKKITQTKNQILFLGASYKKNIGDLKRSPTLEVINLLDKPSCKLMICDPYLNGHDFPADIQFIQKLEEVDLNQFDAIVLMTEHDEFNLKKLNSFKSKIIDPKGLLSLI